MSGGSWDYMFSWDTGQFLERRGDVQLMAKRLLKLGHTDAARAMEELYIVLEHAAIQIAIRQQALREIMQTVEWVDSSDSSEEDLTVIVKKWAGA